MNPSIAVTPPRAVGTVLLIHQSGWAGPDRAKQERLLSFPGRVFVDLGWRTVSIDYARGEAGLQSVKDAVGVELVRSPAGRPVCLYGESAGGHLALLAAAQIPGIDCVITFGAPTDFSLYGTAVHAAGDPVAIATFEDLVVGTFGAPGSRTAPWEPAHVARLINADVLMVRQGDDRLVPVNQVAALRKNLPTISTAVTAVGVLIPPSTEYMHGTLSDTARGQLVGAITAFTRRALSNGAIGRWGRAQHCARANDALGRIGAKRFRTAVSCLVSRQRPTRSRSRPVTRSPFSVTVRVVGQVTPARAVRALLRTHQGASAARRSKRLLAMIIRQSARSRVRFNFN